MAIEEEIKAELRRRHNAGKTMGEDRLNLDALELIETLQAELDKHRWIPVSERDELVEVCENLVYMVEAMLKVDPEMEISPDRRTISRAKRIIREVKNE